MFCLSFTGLQLWCLNINFGINNYRFGTIIRQTCVVSVPKLMSPISKLEINQRRKNLFFDFIAQGYLDLKDQAFDHIQVFIYNL